MDSDFSRPLEENKFVFSFLTKALLLDKHTADEATPYITKAERLLKSMSLKSTLDSSENRRPLHSKDEDRIKLRMDIFNELKDKKRLKDDEAIKLGSGGAKPSVIKKHKEAIIITGLPASGKSSIANHLAELYGAYLIDSDYAKRKIPEFNQEYGASIVHEESTLITFGSTDEKYSEEFSLYEFCIAKGFNVVVPKIGSSRDSLRGLRDALIEKGYRVHLVLVSLDRQESCKRALNRYLETKRYVPLSLIFDVYSNEPTLTYYRVREDPEWTSVGKLSTMCTVGTPPQVVHSSVDSPISLLVSRELAS